MFFFHSCTITIRKSFQAKIRKEKVVNDDYFTSLHSIFNSFTRTGHYCLNEDETKNLLQETGHDADSVLKDLQTRTLTITQYVGFAAKHLRESTFQEYRDAHYMIMYIFLRRQSHRDPDRTNITRQTCEEITTK